MIDDQITLGNLIGYVTLAGGFVALMMNGRKVRRENEEDARTRQSEILEEVRANRETADGRLTKVETRIADFMPRAEIEAKIEHEKSNRTLADNQLTRIGERHSDQIATISVSIGKVEQQQTSIVADFAEMKTLLREMQREFGVKLDKQAEALSQINRKVA